MPKTNDNNPNSRIITRHITEKHLSKLPNIELFWVTRKRGLECDAVVHLRNGQYGLIEVKLGGETLINEGVETLTLLAKQIDTTRMKAPAFKMILTTTGEHAFRRPEDGIYIVPIGCLKQ